MGLVDDGSDRAFALDQSIERNLLIIPGKVFSHHDTHFRISYAASMTTLERGVEILKAMART